MSQEIIFVDKMSYNYFKALLNSLCSLADKELQDRSWGRGDYSVYTSFDEIYMHFADLCEDILKWNSLPSYKQYLLQKFYEMVENYNESYNREEKTEKDVYSDPNWDEIRVFAKTVYDDLKHIKYVPERLTK